MCWLNIHLITIDAEPVWCCVAAIQTQFSEDSRWLKSHLIILKFNVKSLRWSKSKGFLYCIYLWRTVGSLSVTISPRATVKAFLHPCFSVTLMLADDDSLQWLHAYRQKRKPNKIRSDHVWKRLKCDMKRFISAQPWENRIWVTLRPKTSAPLQSSCWHSWRTFSLKVFRCFNGSRQKKRVIFFF